MNPNARTKWWGLAALALPLVATGVAGAQEPAGFDGYIQSGTCAEPTQDVRVDLDSEGSHDVNPYLAKGPDETVVLGYHGSPEAPGFSLSTIYTGRRFSLVIADTDSGDPVACGDILKPDDPAFGEVGVALVQLLPVEGATVQGGGVQGDTVQGVASIQRTQLQRELDVTPTRVRIVLSIGVEVSAPAQETAGYDGHVRSGTCDAPSDDVRVELKSRADHDVNPYLAELPDSEDTVTVAYYGAPGAPGFGLASAHTGRQFSLVLTDDSGDTVACGDILEPDAEKFAEAGQALVRLDPAGDSGTQGTAQGYAVIERTELQRELDITPTRVRIVLFAPAP